MRIAIFGTGGAAGYYGARLATAGEDVAFIARGEHLAAIQQHGLQIESTNGDLTIHPARATADPAEIGEVDAVILGVKTWQVASSAEAMKPMIGPQTVVVPLQNGIEAPDELVKLLGAEHVLGGIARITSMIVGPGRLKQLGAPSIVLAELDNRPSERVDRLRATLENAGIKAPVPADIQAALWGKFLFAASLGGMGAVCRAPVGVLRSVPESRRLLEAAIREVWEAGVTHGIALEEAEIARAMAQVDSMGESGTMSLSRDIIAGRPSELEAWSGAVVRAAEAVGTSAPVHSFIYSTLLPQERRARGEAHFD